MIGSGEDSGFKKINTVNRRMFIFAAAKAVVFFGIVCRLFRGTFLPLASLLASHERSRFSLPVF